MVTRRMAGRSAVLLISETGPAWIKVSKELDREIANRPFSSLRPGLRQKLRARGLEPGLVLPKERTRLRMATVDLTMRCNLDCTYCYRDKSDKRLIEPAILRRIVDRLATLSGGPFVLQVYGGEPLMAWGRIVELMAYVKSKGYPMQLTMETNGALLTRERARQLKEWGATVGVSLDGPPEFQNRSRPCVGGGPSFGAVMDGMGNLRKEGVPFGVLCVLSKINAPHIERLVDFYIQNGIDQVKFNPVFKVAGRPELELTAPEYIAILKRLIRKIYRLRRQGVYFFESNLVTKTRFFLLHETGNICICGGCQGGRAVVAFDVEGQAFPCARLHGYPSCVIPALPMPRKGHPLLEVKLPASCVDCRWVAFCGGGCTASRLFFPDSGFVQQCAADRFLYDYLAHLVLENRSRELGWLEGLS